LLRISSSGNYVIYHFFSIVSLTIIVISAAHYLWGMKDYSAVKNSHGRQVDGCYHFYGRKKPIHGVQFDYCKASLRSRYCEPRVYSTDAQSKRTNYIWHHCLPLQRSKWKLPNLYIRRSLNLEFENFLEAHQRNKKIHDHIVNYLGLKKWALYRAVSCALRETQYTAGPDERLRETRSAQVNLGGRRRTWATWERRAARHRRQGKNSSASVTVGLCSERVVRCLLSLGGRRTPGSMLRWPAVAFLLNISAGLNIPSPPCVNRRR